MKPTLHWAGKQEFHEALIADGGPPRKATFAFIALFDLKFLPRLSFIHAA
jgi:hypothetical protein